MILAEVAHGLATFSTTSKPVIVISMGFCATVWSDISGHCNIIAIMLIEFAITSIATIMQFSLMGLGNLIC
jgi:hypothetical protein